MSFPLPNLLDNPSLSHPSPPFSRPLSSSFLSSLPPSSPLSTPLSALAISINSKHTCRPGPWRVDGIAGKVLYNAHAGCQVSLTECFTSLLPKPKYEPPPREEGGKALQQSKDQQQLVAEQPSSTAIVPPYGQRDGFVPRTAQDYGDGGAYAEIHVAQYPLEMGRKRERAVVARTLPRQLDAQGQLRYDIIARAGHGENRLVQARVTDLLPKAPSEEELARPSPEQIASETREAQRALDGLVRGKLAATQPKNIPDSRGDAQIIHYTPSIDSQHGPTPQARLVKMVAMPVDPLQPPKFHHKRIPRPPPSPPAPRLHTPPRKVTAEEQRSWRIPPCISSWKNPKGYTVPLDKRLAADGKHLQEKALNPRLADLAEALYIAEGHNRREIEMRAAVERKVAVQERRKKDEQLRRLAEHVREEANRTARQLERAARQEDRLIEASMHSAGVSGDSQAIHSTGLGLTIREREQIRQERQYERERELRLSRMGAEQRAKVLEREEGRDISEKIALGMAQPTATRETLYDQRLFDQSQGIASGLHEDDVYNLYDKPLFMGSAAHLIYRPALSKSGGLEEGVGGGGEGEEEGGTHVGGPSRPDRAFLGTDTVAIKEGPVQFEKQRDDPFGVDQFLSEAKLGKRSTAHPHTDSHSSGGKYSRRK